MKKLYNEKTKIITDVNSKRNFTFEKICCMTQEQIKKYLLNNLNGDIKYGDGYLYRQGTTPILLIAHLDTVHKELPKTIVYKDGKIFSPQGIGADDRCGVYMILQIIKKKDCSVLFLEDEELGCVGATKFLKTDLVKTLVGKFKYMIELDRKGCKDAVFYECDNESFTNFITEKYWVENTGSFTDIVELSPFLKVASVNFSCGYYNAHTTNEYVVINEMQRNIEEVCNLIERSHHVEQFEYIEREPIFKNNKIVSHLHNDFYDYYINAYCIYYLKLDGEEYCEVIEATSEYEAIGLFLAENPTYSYNQILFVEEDYHLWD